jgi:4-hydroxy-3-methylbut-2-enyl diphosphate reductase
MGFAEAGGLVVSNPQAVHLLESIPTNQEVCVVAQTTQEVEVFDQVVALLAGHVPELHVYNTICDSTKRRQSEVSRLASQVDMIVVVGGRGSGNTKRLVKVAEARNIPALHVETAEEILPAQLAGAKTVGVTAGASTPNWQIRRVIDRLMEIGMSRRAVLLRNLRKIADIAVMTYVWAALGGGGLTAASLVLQNREVTFLPVAVTMLFVFSMHLLNRIQERSGAVRFNTPEIAAFYSRHGSMLTALGFASSVAAVTLSYFMGIYSCLLLLAMAVTGRLYTTRIVPDGAWTRLRWRSLKDLPGSKTPVVAAGWAVSACLLPVLGSEAPVYLPGLGVAFVFAAGMVFWRTAASDLLDIQGDRIVGRETIPILVGVKQTRALLLILLIVMALLLSLSSLLGVVPTVGYWLLVNLLVFGVFFVTSRRGHLVDRLWFEGVIDGNFVLAGGLSLLYGLY